jgi:cobalt-zinc-cadmium efflux system membrane fusion protein
MHTIQPLRILTILWVSIALTIAGCGKDDHDLHDDDAHTEHTEHADHDEHDGHDDAEHDEHDGHDDEAEDADHDEHDGHDEEAEEADHDGHDEHDAEHDDHGDEAEEADHDEHDGHDEEEAGHAEHGDEDGLRLTQKQRQQYNIKIQKAGPGRLRNELTLPGEVVFNEDRVVHMVPRVSGIVREVRKTVGDQVKAGEVLGVIDSRELADAKAEYMAADARTSLAEKTFNREKTLWEKKVSSEQDFLEAEQAFAEAHITLRSAEQKLHALGLTEDNISKLNSEHDESITRYEIKAPIDGIVTMKHLALGESLAADDGIFTVADMSSVWVNLTVYTKNIRSVAKGQKVALRGDDSDLQTEGELTMVTPFVDEATRSATARVILDNGDGRWIPGTFVTGYITASEENLKVLIPKRAVQVIDGKSVVFIEHEGAFEAIPVTTGRSDREKVEILTGLSAGSPYVAQGAFELKATVITSTLGSHAGHGH